MTNIENGIQQLIEIYIKQNDFGQMNEASNKLLNLIHENCPLAINNFFFYLEKSLDANQNLDPIFIKRVCCLITSSIRIGKKLLSPEYHHFILNQLLKDILLIKLFYSKIYLSYNLQGYLQQDENSKKIVEIFMEIIRNNNWQCDIDSLKDVSVFLHIFSLIVEAYLNQYQKEQILNYYPFIRNFLFSFVDVSINYFTNLNQFPNDQLDENEKLKESIYLTSITSIVNFLKCLTVDSFFFEKIDEFDNQNKDQLHFYEIIIKIVNLLNLNSVPSKLKTVILGFIHIIITEFKQDSPILNILRQPICNSVVNRFFSYKLNSIAQVYLLIIFCKMIRYHWVFEPVIEPVFVNKIVELCNIQSENQFAVYLNCNYPLVDKITLDSLPENEMTSVRHAAFRVLEEICKRERGKVIQGMENIKVIHAVCLNNNQFGCEQRLFVLSSTVKYLSKDPNLYSFLTESANSNDPSLVTTALFGLQFMQTNIIDINLLSCSKIVNQCQPKYVNLMAVRLFNLTFGKLLDESTNDQERKIIEEYFKAKIIPNLPALLTSLLDLYILTLDEESLEVLYTLFQNFSVCCVEAMIRTFELFYIKCTNPIKNGNCTEDDKEIIINSLEKILQLVKIVPNNSQFYPISLKPIIELSVIMIKMFNKEQENILELMTIFFKKSGDIYNDSALSQQTICFLDFLFEFYGQNKKSATDLISIIVELLISMIKNPSILKLNGLIQKLLAFSAYLLSISKEDEDASGMFILSAIVQVSCGECKELALQSINYFSQQQIQQDKLYLYVSQLVLLSSALYFDHSFIQNLNNQNLNNQIINNIIQNISQLEEAEDNYLRIILIGLSIIASQGIPVIYDICAPFLNKLLCKLKNKSQGYFNYYTKITHGYSLPSDDYNFVQSFIGLDQRVNEEGLDLLQNYF